MPAARPTSAPIARRFPTPDTATPGYQVLMPAGIRVVLKQYGAKGATADDLAERTACHKPKLRAELAAMARSGQLLEVEPGRYALL